MKKLLLVFIFIALSFFTTLSVTYATDPIITTTSIEDEFVWTRAASDGYYYVQSQRHKITFSSIYMEFNTTLGDWVDFIVPAAGEYVSRIDIYETDSSAAPIDFYTIAYEAPEATELMFSFEGLGDYEIDTSLLQDKYIQVTLLLNTNPQPVSPSLISNVEFWLNNYPNEYDFNIDVTYINYPGMTIADLPETEGSPYQEGLTGEVIAWEYQELQNQFVATVRYYDEYSITITDIGFGDDAFLENVETIDYYTVEGVKYFQFNFFENENVLLTGAGQFAETWNGFAVWNLTTNELIVYNRALALTYIEVTEDREIFAYLYLPNIPIDDILAVAGHYNYRYGYLNVFGTQKYQEWQTTYFALEKDQTTFGSQGIFEGALPQWSYDAVGYSLAALTVGSVLSMIPGLQVIGIPLLFASAALMIDASAEAIDFAITGKIDEIQTIIPSTTLRSKLNSHYTAVAGALTILPSNASVHKLFTGLYSSPGTNVVEPDADTLVYTEITWVTNGQVYTLDADLIDSEAILDVDYANNLPPEGTNEIGNWWNSTFGENAPWVIGIAIVAVVLWFLPTLDKGLSSASNILKKPSKALALVAIVIIILLITGIIVI